MTCHIQISKSRGVYFNPGCTSAALVLCTLYLCISLAYTLTTRLYLAAYYNSAHVAGLSVFVALFVISHHLFKNNWSLNCTIQAYMKVQIVWTIWALLCCAATGIAYSLLAVTGHLNYDYIAALAFAYVDVFVLLYLLVVSCAGVCGSLSDHRYDFTYHGRNINVYTVGQDQNGLKTAGSSPEPRSCCRTCCRRCCAVFYGLIYFLFHLLFAIIVFLTAYHPATTIHNLYNVQNSSYMYEVKVDGHRPLSLFLRCRGDGSETIMYENGLGGMAMMEWDFIPKTLEDRYRVCVHDRRGYGWSEGYESDYIQTEPQWAKDNVEFFKALVKAADIKTPFYYIGHSYGGIHLAFTAFQYPELIKGLVFLDTAGLSPVQSLSDFLEVLNNFKATGGVQIALDTGLLDYKEAFAEVIDFDYVENETRDDLLASISTGYYFNAYQMESAIFDRPASGSSSYPAEQLTKLMRNGTINKPILVLDAGSEQGFAKNKFSRYEDYFHYGIPGADHQTLVYGFPYVRMVSELIDNFIKLQEGQINNATFVTLAHNITTSSQIIEENN